VAVVELIFEYIYMTDRTVRVAGGGGGVESRSEIETET
jgi:hypothetical protein